MLTPLIAIADSTKGTGVSDVVEQLGPVKPVWQTQSVAELDRAVALEFSGHGKTAMPSGQ